MEQQEHLSKVNFQVGEHLYTIMASKESMKILKDALDMLSNSHYPIVKTDDSSYLIGSNSNFTSEDLFFRIILMLDSAKKYKISDDLQKGVHS